MTKPSPMTMNERLVLIDERQAEVLIRLVGIENHLSKINGCVQDNDRWIIAHDARENVRDGKQDVRDTELIERNKVSIAQLAVWAAIGTAAATGVFEVLSTVLGRP